MLARVVVVVVVVQWAVAMLSAVEMDEMAPLPGRATNRIARWTIRGEKKGEGVER